MVCDICVKTKEPDRLISSFKKLCVERPLMSIQFFKPSFMKNLNSLFVFFLVACFAITGCNENHVSPHKTIGGKAIHNPDRDFPEGVPGRDLPEGIPESDHWRYPYPKIIEREYITDYDQFDDKKCFAWRIEWPDYDASADDDKIPTVFATVNGALNSFDYLNSISSSNTHKTDFSLYYGDKLHASANMWETLDYADAAEMETPYFAHCEYPLSDVIDWVTKRPGLFEIYWPGGSEIELEYEEGDIIQFWLTKANLYGGVRIVQMSPRIIEVYLVVPNI